jgi:dipeptidase
MKELLTALLISGFSFNIGVCQDESGHNCFTILVGKNASADGSVFIAHNEDDLNDHNFVDLHKVPRLQHKVGEKQVFLDNTDSLDEVAETFGYFWITGSKYAEEQYLNEWGVAITSNSSQSKVLIGNGRIDHNLRRIVIERARTAREAVKIAGMIVEKFGYASSGRVYSIADPNEAWVFEVANGKHWIARRVPDDEVAIIPNYYVIDDFHKADTTNFLSSPDLIDYAEANGWYDSQKDTSFNFRKVYCQKNRFDAIWNIARKWVVLNQLAEKRYDFYADFPFSIKPKHKIDIQTLIDALQNHYENTGFEHDPSLNNGSPHHRGGLGVRDTLSVCNVYNDYSCITQLRNWLPAGIGNIMWIAPRYPCIQPFIPWYYGINRVPSDYEKATYREALENYNNKNRNYIELYPGHACWIFDDFANQVDSSYGKESQSLRDWKGKFQADIFDTMNAKESEIIGMYESAHDKALQLLTDVTNGFAERALSETKEKLLRMKTSGRQ